MTRAARHRALPAPRDRRDARDGDPFAPAGAYRAPWHSVPLPDDPDGVPRAGTAGAAAIAGGTPAVTAAGAVATGEEARLVERLIARDERAFNALVRGYERRVFALVLRMLGSRAEAEDLAQEVFVQVFKGIGSFRGESKLSTWIYRIAINLCKNRGKYLKVRHAGEQDQLEEVQDRAALGEVGRSHANVARIDRPDEMVAGKQVERIVQQAILELEPSFRECLVLRDVEDLSYDEIGAITGLPEGTVKSRIHRARAQLKELVERALGEKIE
jgi:RNA polymerase sigma-70 factor (ECF subfamily)